MKNYLIIICSLIFFSCSGEQKILDIFVSNRDVYSVGYKGETGKEKAIYAKNGEVFELESPGETSFGFYIFVSNETVYVAGLMDNKPALWINGKIQILDEDANFTRIDGLHVIGEGEEALIYVLGNVDYDQTKGKNDNIVVWKNGKRIILETCKLCDAFTMTGTSDSVFVTGAVHTPNINAGLEWRNSKISEEFVQKNIYPNRVYLVESFYSDGNLFSIAELEEYDHYAVFKNGELLYKIQGNHARGLQVSMGEIYTGGSLDQKATIWKNGSILYDLSGKYFESGITDLYFDGLDLYIFGFTRESIDGDRIDRVWKNGILIESQECANCLYVGPRPNSSY